jgi:hypothetical protein
VAKAAGGKGDRLVLPDWRVQFAALVPESLIISACAYVIGLRPRLVANPTQIEITNYLSSVSIPWDAWTGFTPGPGSLVITSRIGNVTVAAVPAGGHQIHGKPRTEIVAHELDAYAKTTAHVQHSVEAPVSLGSSESSSEARGVVRPNVWMGRRRFVREMAPKWGDAAANTQWWLLLLRLASAALIPPVLLSISDHSFSLFIACELLLLGCLGTFFYLVLKSFGEASRSLGVRISWTSTPPNNADRYAAWCTSQGLKPYSASTRLPATPDS